MSRANVGGIVRSDAGVRDVTGKHVELLLQVAPGMRRVAVLRNPANPITALLLREVETAARALGLQLQVIEVLAPGEIEGAFESMAKERAAGVVILGDPMLIGQRQRIVDLAIKRRLPSIAVANLYPEAGGLMSYGVNFSEMFRQAASYVDRILKGAKPADLPVEQPTKLELVINIKTAKVLSIKIPHSILLRADKVIE